MNGTEKKKQFKLILRFFFCFDPLGVMFDALFFTADGAHGDSLQAGGLENVMKTVTMRKNVRNAFATLSEAMRVDYSYKPMAEK